VLSFLYTQFVRSRRHYFQSRPDLRRRLAAPVISVGNLTVGGSGKTPLVGEIARLLLEMGERPSILSRGYARMTPSDGVVVVSDGRRIMTDVAHAGDEPYMLARAVPGAVVVVNASRYAAGRIAESRLGSTVHVLDDGFQHVQLRRDVDLLVAPPEDFAITTTLPFGRFREPLDSAAAADALLVPVTGVDGSSRQKMAERLKVPVAFDFSRSVQAPASAAPVFAFAGIATPDDFFGELERTGWQLAGRRAFPDHHIYSPHEMDALERAARESGAEALATTAKDAVRLAGEGARTIPLVEVPLRVSIESKFVPWLEDRLTKARGA
jgi:tetraacyldisaccharide 4'-kinase